MSRGYKTREQWLQAAVSKMRPMVRAACDASPAYVHVSVGFPKGGKKETQHAIGQCFHKQHSADGAHHIFVSPVIQDPVRVLDVLLHELVHVAVGCEVGHRKPFADACRRLGLTGKPTATLAEPGSPLHAKLLRINEELGAYPHSPLSPMRKKEGPKGSSWVRLCSPSDETYTLVISAKSIERVGRPLDPGGEEMVDVE